VGGAGKNLEHRPGKIYFCLCNETTYSTTQLTNHNLQTTAPREKARSFIPKW